MLRAYNTLLVPLRPVVSLWAAWKSRDRRLREEWDERRALRLPVLDPGACWIHGASLGEARIVASLARAVKAERPVLPLAVSALTPAGRSQLPTPPEVDAAFFLPLDFPGFQRRLLDALRPSVLCLVETELWPNLLAEAGARDLPVVVLNARLSEQRMQLYRRFSRLYRPLLGTLARVGAQSEDDAQRLRELGVPPESILVTGNIKYDSVASSPVDSTSRAKLALAGPRAVWVAGSTGEGEEGPVLDAFEHLRRERLDSLLVLAPRHLARVADVERQVGSRGLSVVRWSRLSSLGREDVVLVDTLGELSSLYGLAQVAFVGGSLVAVGGHNVLEPAALGIPVLFGPHTQHVAGPAEALERAGGALRVRDGAELGEAVARLLRDSDRRAAMGRAAVEVVRAHRGALARSVALLLAVLDRPAAKAAGFA